MFGLTRREQRWKADQAAAEVLAGLAGIAIRATAEVRIAEAKTDAEMLRSQAAEIDRLRCNAEVLQRLHDEDGIEHNKLRTQNQALREALTHAVEIAEARRNGTWDDLLQYRALIAQAEGGV